LTGTAKLAYRFTDNVMSYLSYARGYKAGGFNLDRERTTGPLGAADPATSVDRDTSFPAELADSYELGTKTEWLADSLIVNAAAFYQQFSDFQLNTFTGITFVVASVPEVVSYGIDTDVLWNTPWERLTLQGGLTYARTRIEEFGTTAAFFSPERKSNQLSFAPEWSTNLSATYEQPLSSDLLLRFNVGAKYTSEYNTGSDLAPGKVQEPLTLLNARIGIGNSAQHWTVEAWAQNLTNEDYFQVIFDAPLQPGTRDAFLGSPRMYGVTARFTF
jgi:iron complex outermembrane recepter protein